MIWAVSVLVRLGGVKGPFSEHYMGQYELFFETIQQQMQLGAKVAALSAPDVDVEEHHFVEQHYECYYAQTKKSL